ncbi:MAG: complex I NDUFA9 subunit family protein [Pseudorhodoplanes sp.]
MNDRIVTVFGGTGFLGRRIARHLCERGFAVRVASRHPDRGNKLFARDYSNLQSVAADITDEQSITSALAGASGAVNAVSLYVERGQQTFHSVHVEAAQRVAAQAHRGGVERFVQVSGIGSDASSRSLYIRKRGEGELAVRAAFPDAILVRSAVMFGPDDAFLTTIVKLLRQLPIYPMFGRGLTKLQPVYVEDVAEAVAELLRRPAAHAATFECVGPRVYSYKEFVTSIALEAGLRTPLVPMPFSVWHSLAWLAEMFPRPPIARNQVELMEIDNVSSPDTPGFEQLGISPRSVDEILHEIVKRH